MTIPYKQLQQYVSCALTPQEVADALAAVGFKVTGTAMRTPLAEVVVAEVLTCEAHPDSDHLHVTTVDDGTGAPVTVVCGAPNVAAGQKVLFARIGAVLPGNFKIKRSKIRGVESFGMICAEDELGIGESHAGIMVLPPETVPGTPARDYLHLADEPVIEVDLNASKVDDLPFLGLAGCLYRYLKAQGIPCTLA